MIEKEKIIKDLKCASVYLNNKVEHEPDTYDEKDVEAFADIALVCTQVEKVLENAIVLPCPMGSTIYRVYSRTMCNGKTKVIGKILRTKLTWNNLEHVLNNFGTKYFLSRKDAETATKGEQI